MRILYIAILAFLSTPSFSQTMDEQLLAEQYYQKGEYEKAVTIYEKLFNRSSSTSHFYKNYLNSLYALKNLTMAEKIVRKQIKKYPNDLTCLIDLGYTFTQMGNMDKAKQQYEKAINALHVSEVEIKRVASGFWSINEYDYAIKTYQKGKKVLKNKYAFNYELGLLYAKKNDIPRMINIYLDILFYNPQQEQMIKNTLQDELQSDKDNKELRTQLYKRIQKNPDNAVYVNLLVWLLIQQKDFESAFVQIKALHKRLKEHGSRILKFARLAVSNRYYDIAIEAYQYVIKEGNNYTILIAKKGMLNTKKEKIVDSGSYSYENVIALQKNYEQFLNEYGKNTNTASTIRELAHLEAYYLHNVEKAITLLENIINNNAFDKHLRARSKLDLGDIYLIKGEIWEAMLFYMQVDKAFKDEPIGDKARFNVAKLSYYNGDFEWAQTQLDVLKGSTSKLIANDAIELSTFIIDNMGLDTNTIPLNMYVQAELLNRQNKWEEATKKFDAVLIAFPGHVLTDDILFSKAMIHIKQKQFEEAAPLLKEITDNHSFDILADNALFTLAELYQYNLGVIEKAKKSYHQLLIKYPDSIFSTEARKRYRQLRGDSIN